MKQYLLIAFLVCSSLCQAQDRDCFKLLDNEIELDSTTNLGSNNVFVVGEFHGVYGTSEVKLALIKYVNKRYDIIDVFMEIGYSAAWLYNRYLESGDTSFFSAPLLVYAGKQPNREFWKALYKYNKTLKHKITIHGIDFERMEFVKALKLLRPLSKRPAKEIAATFVFLDSLTISGVNDDALSASYEQVKKNIGDNRESYAFYYGSNMKVVDEIMFNENTLAKYRERNQTMYQNLVKQTQQGSIKKFISFNGMNHADRSDDSSLCSLIMKNDSFKNKTVNIAMVCRHCYDLQLADDKQTSFRAPYTYEKDSASLNSLYSKQDSHSCKYKLIATEPLKEDKIRKYSQYLILMKDQPVY